MCIVALLNKYCNTIGRSAAMEHTGDRQSNLNALSAIQLKLVPNTYVILHFGAFELGAISRCPQSLLHYRLARKLGQHPRVEKSQASAPVLDCVLHIRHDIYDTPFFVRLTAIEFGSYCIHPRVLM